MDVKLNPQTPGEDGQTEGIDYKKPNVRYWRSLVDDRSTQNDMKVWNLALISDMDAQPWQTVLTDAVMQGEVLQLGRLRLPPRGCAPGGTAYPR